MCFDGISLTKILCDAYYEEDESHLRAFLDISLGGWEILPCDCQSVSSFWFYLISIKIWLIEETDQWLIHV